MSKKILTRASLGAASANSRGHFYTAYGVSSLKWCHLY